jgi:hypothetical protein
VLERCERCGDEVGLEERTVVLSSDSHGEMREYVYCSSHCAMAPGSLAAATLDALAAVRPADDAPRARPGGDR